jgi:aminodeoxyfutalosine synthase
MNSPAVSPELEPVREKVLSGQRLTRDDGLTLFGTRDLHGLGALAQWAAQRKHGRDVCYVVNCHINYSNYCTLACAFCSFYRRKERDPRPGGYELALEEIHRRADEAAQAGATEIHCVGGLHPDLPFSYYVDLVRGIRQRQPRLGLKCFSAAEIRHIATLAGLSLEDALIALREAGLDTLPGGGAEILDDEVRKKICAEKDTSAEWLEVHRVAHRIGIRSNATMLFGHVETAAQRVEHLLRLRELQDETGGFLAFVPLSYHPEHNVLQAERGPSAVDELRTHAAARLLLDNIPHIKAYWVALSVPVAQVALSFGATDLDGTVRQESVYHMAGARTPQELTAGEMQRLIREAGLTPVERDHLYRRIMRRGDEPQEWDVERTAGGCGT